MGNLLFGLTFASAVGSGLIAGLFYAFSTFIMKALSNLPAAQGIAAMQSINVTILNPLFILVFMGTSLASLILGIFSSFNLGEVNAVYLLAGGVFYFIGSFLVTVVYNVPLNDALAAADPATSEGVNLWNQYLSRWLAWNHVRTVASLAALICFIIALRKW